MCTWSLSVWALQSRLRCLPAVSLLVRWQRPLWAPLQVQPPMHSTCNSSSILGASPFSLALSWGAEHIFPFTWNYLKGSLTTIKIRHAICLQEMHMFKIRCVFFHPWVSQNYNWGQPTKHAKSKGERTKELHVWEASPGLCFCSHLPEEAPLKWCSVGGLWLMSRACPRWDMLASV